jgi:hypothetical protein
MIDVRAISRSMRIELVDADKLLRFFQALEVEPVPVDYRIPREDEAQRLGVAQRQGLNRLEAGYIWGARLPLGVRLGAVAMFSQ